MMISPAILYTTAALLVLVAIACTALCLVWSIPAWRHWLTGRAGHSNAQVHREDGLSGWPARVGSGLVSAGIASCALVAWYGLYWTIAAI
jgi:hypothetical protein